jgi:hypothetical protein
MPMKSAVAQANSAHGGEVKKKEEKKGEVRKWLSRSK